MIKDIRKVDLQGNEYYQESVICNRCKRVLSAKEFYYTIKISGYHPVKIEPRTAYGLKPREPWHICDECYKKVAEVLDGNDVKSSSIIDYDPLECWTTKRLKDFRNSHMCSVEDADRIDKILKDRGAI